MLCPTSRWLQGILVERQGKQESWVQRGSYSHFQTLIRTQRGQCWWTLSTISPTPSIYFAGVDGFSGCTKHALRWRLQLARSLLKWFHGRILQWQIPVKPLPKRGQRFSARCLWWYCAKNILTLYWDRMWAVQWAQLHQGKSWGWAKLTPLLTGAHIIKRSKIRFR